MTSSALAAPREAQQAASPLRVLLLEDSELDAELIEAQIDAAGLSFELTRVDGHSGFNEALSGCGFDIILSDFNIPGFDGMSALAAAHLACPQVPFLFVSGALGEDKAIELLKRGATDYVLKDRLERLVPSMQRALREAQDRARTQESERALRHSEARFRSFVEATSQIVWTTDPQGHANEDLPSWRAFTGQSREDVLELGRLQAAHPEDLPALGELYAGSIGARRPFTATFRLRRHDGEWRTVVDRAVPVLHEDGRVREWVGTTTDVTEQKLAEEEVRRRAEFEQQLIGIVSHDLRNPLNAITVSAAMLVRQEGLDERSTKGVRRILSSAERAARMIRDLLDFTQARLGGGIPVQAKPMDLHSQIQGALDEIQHTHPERELVLVQEGDTLGEWDPDRLSQVAANLVTNAIKYSPEGSAVTVRTRGETDSVVLEVHNWGEGIAPERIPELFKPLSRGAGVVDLQTRSIGLGLYIVDSIVRAHGGTVEARSSQEEGTTFLVRLPRP